MILPAYMEPMIEQEKGLPVQQNIFLSDAEEISELILEKILAGETISLIPTNVNLYGVGGQNLLTCFGIWQDKNLRDFLGITDLTILDVYIIAEYLKQTPLIPFTDYIDAATGEVKTKFGFDQNTINTIRRKYSSRISEIKSLNNGLDKFGPIYFFMTLSEKLANISHEQRQLLSIQPVEFFKDEEVEVDRSVKLIDKAVDILRGAAFKKYTFSTAVEYFKEAIKVNVTVISEQISRLMAIHAQASSDSTTKNVVISVNNEIYSTIDYLLNPNSEKLPLDNVITGSLYASLINIFIIKNFTTTLEFEDIFSEKQWQRVIIKSMFFRFIQYYCADLSKEEQVLIVNKMIDSIADDQIDQIIEKYDKSKVKFSIMQAVIDIMGSKYKLDKSISVKANWVGVEP